MWLRALPDKESAPLFDIDETDNLEPPDHFEAPVPVQVAFPPVSEDANFLLLETFW